MAVPYFPIHNPAFEMTMNARAYDGALIEIEPVRYAEQISERRSIACSDPEYYHACIDESAMAMSWEALQLILRDMASRNPQWFEMTEDAGRIYWRNRLLGEGARLTIGDVSSLPGSCSSPLAWLGGQVQEDLIVMLQRQLAPAEADGGEAVCVAGHLCFGAGWCIGDKLEKSFGEIHAEVPGFAEQIGLPSDRLMRRLKPGRSVMRFNWTVSESDDLNRAPRFRQIWLPKGLEVTSENAGEHCYFRVEKQTLTRLPKSRGILFTIHTYINTIGEVCAYPERRRLLHAALRDMPPATIAYKNAGSYYAALLAHLGHD